MCNRCDDSNPLFVDRLYFESLTNEWYLDIQWDDWRFDDDNTLILVPVHRRIYVNYCPWCGRKLEECIHVRFPDD